MFPLTRRWLLSIAALLVLAAACTSAASVDEVLTRQLSVLGSDQTTSVIELADGRPAVVNFWATWCAFCVDEMPNLQAVFEELDGQVAFVGVDREDVAREALELAEETGVTYPLLEDPDASFFFAARGLGMPTTLFVNAAGEIVFRHSGPLTAPQLRQLVREHLGVTA